MLRLRNTTPNWIYSNLFGEPFSMWKHSWLRAQSKIEHRFNTQIHTKNEEEEEERKQNDQILYHQRKIRKSISWTQLRLINIPVSYIQQCKICNQFGNITHLRDHIHQELIPTLNTLLRCHFTKNLFHILNVPDKECDMLLKAYNVCMKKNVDT